jgi:hypothetical protein
MKKIGSKFIYLATGILSFFSLWPVSATPIPQHPMKHLDEVKTTTPLYLQLGADIAPQVTQEKELNYVRHWQHWSHRSHRSHYAHYAHRSHYSHYNYYR